jgi:membrane protein
MMMKKRESDSTPGSPLVRRVLSLLSSEDAETAQDGFPAMLVRAWRVLRQTAYRMKDKEGAVRAAALAFFGLLSIFPLLLLLAYVASLLLASSEAQAALHTYLNGVTPQLGQNVGGFIEQSVRLHGTLGLISAVGLIWSGSAVLNALAHAINLIWGTRPRSLLRRRLLALLSVILIVGLFLASLSLSLLGIWAGSGSRGWGWVNDVLGFFFAIWLFWLIYRTMPNRRVDGRAALCGGLLAALLWQAIKYGFGWYLTSGWSRYGLIYGSLASLIILLIWLFLSALITLLGAAFAASLEAELWPARIETRGKDTAAE